MNNVIKGRVIVDYEKCMLRVDDSYNTFQKYPKTALEVLRKSSIFGHFNIEDSLKELILNNINLIDKIDIKDISNEFLGFMCGEPYKISILLKEYFSVFKKIIPELEPMVGFEQHKPNHIYDVWEHTLHVLYNIDLDDSVLINIAALFHDIGKPYTFSIDDNGIGHFDNHERTSASIAYKILTRLKINDEYIEKILFLILHHNDNTYLKEDVNKEELKAFIKTMICKYEYNNLKDLYKLQKADIIGHGGGNYRNRLYYINKSIKCLNLLVNENLQQMTYIRNKKMELLTHEK